MVQYKYLCIMSQLLFIYNAIHTTHNIHAHILTLPNCTYIGSLLVKYAYTPITL